MCNELVWACSSCKVTEVVNTGRDNHYRSNVLMHLITMQLLWGDLDCST